MILFRVSENEETVIVLFNRNANEKRMISNGNIYRNNDKEIP